MNIHDIFSRNCGWFRRQVDRIEGRINLKQAQQLRAGYGGGVQVTSGHQWSPVVTSSHPVMQLVVDKTLEFFGAWHLSASELRSHGFSWCHCFCNLLF